MTALIDSYCRQYQQNICPLFVCKYPELKFAALTTLDPDWFVVFVYSHIKENHEKKFINQSDSSNLAFFRDPTSIFAIQNFHQSDVNPSMSL